MTAIVTSTHGVFDNALPTVLTIENGDTVTFECPSAFDWGLDATVDDLVKLRPYPHRLCGPIEVSGAEPGDALEIEILAVDATNNYGTIVVFPGFGLLPDDFTSPFVRVVSYADGMCVLKPGVRVPLEPFLGIMAVAPAETGEHSTTPPRSVGGNLDIRHLRPGTKLTLPVAVPGALFSCGDGHACQGDGEVCGTAVEASLRATLRFTLRKGAAPTAPLLHITKPLERKDTGAGYVVTTGLGPDLRVCAQEAIRRMIALLVDEHELSREEAFALCSMTVDLRISEIVNAPNWLVSAYLPLATFADG
jgi:acetamidase/formamidase